MSRSDAAFVTSHTDLAQHEKTRVFCDTLGIRRTEGVGLVHLLWHYTARTSPDRGIIDCSPAVLADEVFWAGDPSSLVQAFVEAGFVEKSGDVLIVHEWSLHGGDHVVVRTGKKAYDRQRLQSLRRAEQQSLPIGLDVTVGTTTVTINDESRLPEPLRIFVALKDDEKARPNDLRRIQRTLDLFPRQSGYDVALNYVAWQEQVSLAYRDNRSSPKPHVDRIKGWNNQMKMHAGKNWTLREDLAPANEKRVVAFSEEDIKRFSS